MRLALWIGLGSGLGGMLRYLISGWIASRVGQTFPWGTITVNVVGSFLIGLLAALSDSQRWIGSPEMRQFLMLGFLGGFTTFSSFSLQTLRLVQDGEWWPAAGNVVGTTALCLLFVLIGYKVGQ
ncbi:MAG: fluoride efflux transporter CrcB [Opitutaceae bacterium]